MNSEIQCKYPDIRLPIDVTSVPFATSSAIESDLVVSPKLKEMNETKAPRIADVVFVVKNLTTRINVAPLPAINAHSRFVVEHCYLDMEKFIHNGLGKFFVENYKKIKDRDLKEFRQDHPERMDNPALMTKAKQLSKTLFGAFAYILLAIRYIRKQYLNDRHIYIKTGGGTREFLSGGKDVCHLFMDSVNELIPEGFRPYFYEDLFDSKIVLGGHMSSVTVNGDPNLESYTTMCSTFERKGVIEGIFPLNPFNHKLSDHRAFMIRVKLGAPCVAVLTYMENPHFKYYYKAVLADASYEEAEAVMKAKNPKNEYIKLLARKFEVINDSTGDSLDFDTPVKINQVAIKLVELMNSLSFKIGLDLCDGHDLKRYFVLTRLGFEPTTQLIENYWTYQIMCVMLDKLKGFKTAKGADNILLKQLYTEVYKMLIKQMGDVWRLRVTTDVGDDTVPYSRVNITAREVNPFISINLPDPLVENAPNRREIKSQVQGSEKMEMVNAQAKKQELSKPSHGFNLETRKLITTGGVREGMFYQNAMLMRFLMKNLVIIKPMYNGDIIYKVTSQTSVGGKTMRSFFEELQILTQKDEDHPLEGQFMDLKTSIEGLHVDPISQVNVLMN